MIGCDRYDRALSCEIEPVLSVYLGPSYVLTPVWRKQRGPGEVRDRRLQTIEAVVERQQRVLAEGDDDRLLLDCEHGEARLLGAHRASAVVVRLRHFCTVVGLTP